MANHSILFAVFLLNASQCFFSAHAHVHTVSLYWWLYNGSEVPFSSTLFSRFHLSSYKTFPLSAAVKLRSLLTDCAKVQMWPLFLEHAQSPRCSPVFGHSTLSFEVCAEKSERRPACEATRPVLAKRFHVFSCSQIVLWCAAYRAVWTLTAGSFSD